MISPGRIWVIGAATDRPSGLFRDGEAARASTTIVASGSTSTYIWNSRSAAMFGTPRNAGATIHYI
jgi:hypothetical protein